MNNPFRVSLSQTPVNQENPTENAAPTMGVWAVGPVSNAVAGSIHRKRTQRSVQKQNNNGVTPDHLEEYADIPPGYLTAFHVQQETSSRSTEIPLSASPHHVNAGHSRASFRVTKEGTRPIHKYTGLGVPPLSRFGFPSLVPPTLHPPRAMYQSPIIPNTLSETAFPTFIVPQLDDIHVLMDQDDISNINTIMTPSTAEDSSNLTAARSLPSSQSNSTTHGATLSNLLQARRSERTQKPDQVLSILRSLQKVNMTTLDLLLAIHGQADWVGTQNESQKADIKRFQQGFFSNQGPAKFRQMLTAIWKSKDGREVMEEWMDEHAVDYVCEVVSREIEAAKKPLFVEMKDVTTEYTKRWGIHLLMDPIIVKYTPTWFKVLTAATTPKDRCSKGYTRKGKEEYRDRAMSRAIITSQVIHTRSQASALVQVGLGLLTWTCGASRKIIEVLHRCGLSPSYPTISKILDNLANSCVNEAGKIARAPHMFCYDNINVETSIHIEQTSNTPNKVQSGSFALIYPLYNATPEKVKLAPILDRFRTSKPLLMTDIRPSIEGATLYTVNTLANIIKILVKYVREFAYLKDSAILQNQRRRPLPKNLKTKFYPLRATTIEEATVQGNLMIHDDAYEVQLKFSEDELNQMEAILSINDQLTNSRIRSAQIARALDLSPWDRRERFLLAFGLFHLIMNMLWAILNAHRGRLRDHGSLNHLFAIIEKTRLGSEKPDYYTLLAALTQVVDGLIINAWRTDFGDLKKLGLAKPSPDEILIKARIILQKYCTPTHIQEPKSKSRSKNTPNLEDCEALTPTDTIHANVILLIHDLLFVVELISAVTDGDFGRIEDILPDIACLFRGAGSNNYSMEVLHILHNFKEVWTPEFSNVVRDNMLINPSGLEGHFMPVDLNIEHNIGYLKGLFADKGVRANWDRLGNISASINHLQDIKKQAFVSLHTSYQGSTHTEAKTSDLVWKIANAARDSNLQVMVPGRRDVKASPNLCALGYTKYESGSLASFNEKIQNMKAGVQLPLESDDLPAMEITFNVDFDEIEFGEMDMGNLNDVD